MCLENNISYTTYTIEQKWQVFCHFLSFWFYITNDLIQWDKINSMNWLGLYLKGWIIQSYY